MLAGGAVWPGSTAEAQYFPSHRIVEIPVFGPDPSGIGFSEALGINESGEVVGRATVGPDHTVVHAFVWLPQARPDWRLPGSPTLGVAAGLHDLTEAVRQIPGFTLATDGAALDINVHGQIVGEQVVAPGAAGQAFMWDLAGLYSPTAQVIVPSVDGLPSKAWDINDGYLDAVVAAERDVEGCALDNHGRKEALRVLLGSPSASITLLEQNGPDARNSLAALAVNTPAAGQAARVVGTGDLCGPQQLCSSDFDAVWWGQLPNSGQTLAEAPTALATALGINDTGVDGEIVGYGQFSDPQFGGCTLHAWYWSSPGVATHFDLHTGAQPPVTAARSFAEEISNSDACGRTHVAGWMELPAHACLWRRLSPTAAWAHLDLDASSAGLLCGWGPLARATDVNSSGMVVGFADRNPSPTIQANRGFLLLSTECIADVTGEGNVDGADLGLLLSDWGPCADPTCIHCQPDVIGCRFDFDCSGIVDGADLGTLLTQWTETGCPCALDSQESLLSESVSFAIQSEGAALKSALATLGFESLDHFAAWGSGAPTESLSAVAQSLRVLLATSLDGPLPD